MKFIVHSLRFSLLLLLFVASRSFAQEEGGAAGLTLRLCDADGNTISTCVTKDDGSWSLSASKPGDYSIVVQPDEFAEARKAINTKGTGAKLRTAAPGTGAFASNSTQDLSDDAKIRTASLDENASPMTINFSWSMKDDATVSCVVSPRDAASGLPTGKRQRTAVMFIKEFDKSAPTLTCAKACTLSGNVSYTAKAGKSGRTK
jgi:hypothetical protein